MEIILDAAGGMTSLPQDGSDVQDCSPGILIQKGFQLSFAKLIQPHDAGVPPTTWPVLSN